MMDLDDFSDYRVSVSADNKHLHLRHHNCSKGPFMKSIEFMPPFDEVNMKNLMVEVAAHWHEVHENGA